MNPVKIEFDRREIIRREIDRENGIVDSPEERVEKYKDMLVSPFSFYRATAHLYYRDIREGIIAVPENWKSKSVFTWLSGDMHTQNFGFFDNSMGDVKFDLNDFDESYVGPVYWDLIRYCISVRLHEGLTIFPFSEKDADEMSAEFLNYYRETLVKIQKDHSYLQRELTGENLGGFLAEKQKTVASSKKSAVKKWCRKDKIKYEFDFSNPDLEKPDSKTEEKIKTAAENYIRKIRQHYASSGLARRLNSGLGSQGLDKYYLLMKGTDSDKYILLEMKQQKLPSMFLTGEVPESDYIGMYKSHAARSSAALHTMLENPDVFTGFFRLDGTDYIIKKISDYKTKVKPEDFRDRTAFKNYMKYSARSAALAHSRSQRKLNHVPVLFEDAMLGALNRLPESMTVLKQISNQYAEQVFSDFLLFKELISEKNL